MVRHPFFHTGRALPFVVILLGAMPLTGQQGASNGQWRHYYGDTRATRYSPVDQINKDNVEDLWVAWRWKSDNFGVPPEYKNETTPLYVDGTLYFTAGITRAVVAVDAETGETMWVWRMDEGERGKKAPRRNSGRGVSHWTDGKDERIFVVTPGFHLVALNPKTGQQIASFAKNGVVDLKATLGLPGLDLVNTPIGNSSPPIVSRDVVVVTPALEQGGRPKSKKNVPGFVQAFDARTGKQLWVFHTVPRKGEQGYETWENGSAEYTGNAGVWASASADEELGYLYLPVEAATSDWYGGHRLGNNLYSSSLVCLDITTGKMIWHYQIVHHDIFDYDNPTAPILADVTVDGKRIKAVAQLTKQAYAYVFDRVTGKPIWPIDEKPVGKSDVPGERAAETQPIPTKPPPFDRQGVSKDDLVDFTPAVNTEALRLASQYRLGPLFTPVSLANAADGTKGLIMLPGAGGGALWEHGAFDPETGILYVGSATNPALLALTKDPKLDIDYVVPAGLTVPNPFGLPLIKPPYGRITAIDLNRGEVLWMTPNGETPREIRNNPLLRGVKIPPTGSRSRAGILVTKTLLFAGEGWGGQPYFRARDKRTGKIVWETKLPGVQTGLPMTYMHKGQQYIAFTVGDQDTDHPAELVSFRLANRPKPPTTTSSSDGDGNATSGTNRAYAEVSWPDAEGWSPLFDGKTLTGWWPSGQAEWKVEDGAISAIAKDGASYLRTTREFANFELKAEFWGDKTTNSGIFVRCPTRAYAPISQRSCYEVNISDSHETFPTGSIVDVARIDVTPDTAGKWNTFEIVADGPHVVVKLNGKVTVDVRDEKLVSGTIALQAFGQGVIRFRNISIRPIGVRWTS